MKMSLGLKLLQFGFLAILFAGCATTHIDWNARVGHYTFDQAVVELGPPDKQARLTSGQLVAEWVTRYNNGGTVFVNPGFYPGQVGFVQTIGPTTYVDRLLLTFGTNNVLSAWAKK